MATTPPFLALLLEDEAFIAMDVEDALSAKGIGVQAFSRCAEAAQWLQANKPHLGVLDIQLADGPCIAEAKMLVERNVPFIVCSGHDPESVDPVFESGTWVSKPADSGIIAATALRLLAN